MLVVLFLAFSFALSGFPPPCSAGRQACAITADLKVRTTPDRIAIGAQAQEFARVLRNGDEATLSVFGPRPVDLAAMKLAEEFGAAVNVEDPIYLERPESALLEIPIGLRPDGSLRDVRQVVSDLVDAANAELPFAYRIDRDQETLTIVATRTRDKAGRPVDLTRILDRRVTLPPGTRSFNEHVALLTRALAEQAGIPISCCFGIADNHPGPPTLFRADDEPARSALLRLVRSRPARQHLVRNAFGNFNLVPSEPGGYHWLMRCDPIPPSFGCFINLRPIPDRR